MCKHTTILILGLLFTVLFIKSAISTEDDDKSDSDSDDLALRDDHDSDEIVEKVGKALRGDQSLSGLLQKRQSFTDAQRQFQKQALDAHNVYRARHCAQPLVLDDALSRSAQNYAQKLASTNSFQHSGTQGVGATAVKLWYDEIKQYNFNSGGFSSATGHFTQVVWKGSRKLGMGVAYSNGGRSAYVVAQYTPPGNYMGRFTANVRPANSC
ncbi:unnamed protein product [Rotaria socialis]|uniref:SCP domain-containing protein n=1 Tax=Rotaria socialis TaxID=392032 RepID=A0A821RB27_9BILA|nr:unnamed protein product [Rotaria socialis]CAF3403686.1 unnamed protein product [Rotaria socialis]CAF3447654.1 unnamed protein product [Rotaria socialis]CAF3530210.1 unnamed protein product [Rotaria socialis]CAF4388038.1 unnamed protein product [Rotaria socialis]